MQQYPPGYTHPANIALDSDYDYEEDDEDPPPDGTDTSTLRAKQHERGLRRQAAKERKEMLARIPTPGPSWFTTGPPSRELDGQATWGEIPSFQPGPSTHRGHDDRQEDWAAEPGQREVFELLEHTTDWGTIIHHYTKEDWPSNVRRLVATLVGKADRWSYFIPRSSDDAYGLIQDARDQGAGAAERTRHLVAQYNQNMELQSINSLSILVSAWQNPAYKASRPPRSIIAPSGQWRMMNPRLEDPPDVWNKYWVTYPSAIPPQLRGVVLPNGTVSDFIIRGNAVLKSMMPYYKKTGKKTDNPRLPALEAIVRLFSIPGLFHVIVKDEHLERPLVQHFEKIQRGQELCSEKDIARWAAQCGITDESVMQAERTARLYRNYDLKRPAEDLSPWPDYPATINDILNAPPAPTKLAARDPMPPSCPESRASRRSASCSRARSASCPPNPAPAVTTVEPGTAPVVSVDKGKKREDHDEDTVSLMGSDSPRPSSPASSNHPD